MGSYSSSIFCFIVNKQLEVLNLYGDSKDFFRLASGKVTNDLNKLLNSNETWHRK
jgi:hypothetical protein